MKEYNNWVMLNKNPWDAKYKERLENCDSTMAGPCGDSIEAAKVHETRVYEFAAKYKELTGKDTGIARPKDPVDPKSKDKPSSLFSFELATSTKIFLATAVFAGIYLAANNRLG